MGCEEHQAPESTQTAGDATTAETPQLPPGPPTISVTPQTPRTVDAIVASGAAQYRWLLAGELVLLGQTLAPEYTQRGQTWRVEGTVSNAAGTSPPGVLTVTIENTPPSCQDVQVQPQKGQWRCLCPLASDPDNDPVQQTRCSWALNDASLGESSCALPPAVALKRGDSLSCEIALSDGEAWGAGAKGSTIIPDSLPSGGQVSLTPTKATELSVMQCAGSGATDRDGDSFQWSYRWERNGELISHQGSELTGEWFNKGDSLRCLGSAGAAPPISSEAVVIDNTPPALDPPVIDPPAAGRLESLTCVTGAIWDPDPADDASVVIEWLRFPSDELAGEGPTLDLSNFSPGDRLRCRASPTDGVSQGASEVSLPAEVTNAPPELTSVHVTPSSPTALDTLSCAAQVNDLEGDPVALSVTWLRNGQILSGEIADTLSGAFSRGDQLACQVSPADPFDDGPAMTSEWVSIANTPPTVSVSVQGGPHWCAPLQCVLSSLTDADGDLLETSLQWEGAGAVSGENATASGPGEALICTVTVTDGTDITQVSATVMPTASQTSAQAAIVLPASPVQGELLSCQAVGAYDPCSEAISTLATEWWVDGAPAAAGPTLDTTPLSAGSTVRCAVTVTGGNKSTPATVESPPVILQAPPPQAPQIGLVAPQGADGPITCAVVVENTPGLPLQTVWQLNDGDEFEGAATLPEELFHHCDRVRCWMRAGELESNLSELVLPVGADCEDSNPCTQASCAVSTPSQSPSVRRVVLKAQVSSQSRLKG